MDKLIDELILDLIFDIINEIVIEDGREHGIEYKCLDKELIDYIKLQYDTFVVTEIIENMDIAENMEH